MLDIIIPSYNDEQGLYNTLMSFGNINYGWEVWIIDDNSTDKIDYDKIESIFSQFYPIHIIKSPNNVGPGGIRQIGLLITKNEYIAFIDCGDRMIAPNLYKFYLDFLDKTSECAILCTSQLIEYDTHDVEIFYPEHNRMHGKIYRRKFLNDYNISFNVEFPRVNEDICFNKQCRITAKILNAEIIYENNKVPLIIQTFNKNSLTRINDNAFIYSTQNEGLGRNMIYALNNILKTFPNISIDLLINDIDEVFVFMYTSYLNTCCTRPEFKEEMLNGAKLFYNEYKELIHKYPQALAEEYHKGMRNAYFNEENFVDSPNNISFNEFLVLLNEDISHEKCLKPADDKAYPAAD